MSTRRKRASTQQPVGTPASSNSASAPAIPLAITSVSAETILNECVGAICLVEVTLHSLESQEIAYPEQEVLRRALKLIWSVHDWIYELKPQHKEDEVADREGEL